MGQKYRQLLTALLLVVLIAGCTAAPAAQSTAIPPAAYVVQTADVSVQAGESGGKEILPTPPPTVSEKNGYHEYAGLFYRELEKGDAIAASAYMWFDSEGDRALWIERFAAPDNAKLVSVSRVSLNLWAMTVEESLGSDIPPTQTVYYVAWYDGSYRIFPDPPRLPADMLRDQDYGGMPVEKPVKSGGGITPDGEDQFPPEDGQAEKWYRERQAELAAVKAAADKAVRALPEADTVTSFDNPKVELVDVNTVRELLTAEPQGSKLLVYAVTYPTGADAVLGPIVLYLDSEANVLGFAPRE
ncbi:MAG: hypothetical protein K6F56_06270 [Oscillospiraceae bacterium]|nr:hypothetical protein [Oscillospiraceae bacterium]